MSTGLEPWVAFTLLGALLFAAVREPRVETLASGMLFPRLGEQR